ncbi:MAG: ATP-dependent Clp protease ATP-binding subunit [Paracoccaceae bacterium]
MLTSSGSIPAHDPPAWFDEFSSSMHYASHLALSGNIRDLFPTWTAEATSFVHLDQILERLLARQGVGTVVRYDPVGGLRVGGDNAEAISERLTAARVPMGTSDLSLAQLAQAFRALSASAEIPVALIVDYASHLAAATETEREAFFVQIDRQTRRQADKNPKFVTIWLVDHVTDLPDWFAFGNDLLRDIHVELPNLEDRFLYALHLSNAQATDPETTPALDTERLQHFAIECDGETLIAMRSIMGVARAEGITIENISDAIRVYRTGMRRNPWASHVLRDRLKNSAKILNRRIKGQDHALDRCMDILARSAMGLSSAQTGSRQKRPRGVMFLAGPTGVGKTEMAKAVTELLFGDDAACHRFDMSEFMEENAITRLLGAPPGHPGHERGGELVNAAHRRPFSVFLFDEVEKAHPRILDIFLQVLDEGRLTDARGASAYFSEALIIFTSNIGIMTKSTTTNQGMSALPSDSHKELERKISKSVEMHFRNELQRPELLNRIGQNIVVFDFLSGEAAYLIFESMMERVVATIKRERGIDVELTPEAHEALRRVCTSDFFQGGRGIGNRIEENFINPLARALFDRELSGRCTITGLKDPGPGLVLEVSPIS